MEPLTLKSHVVHAGHTKKYTTTSRQVILSSSLPCSCCYLVSGAADGSVKVWEFSTCNPLHSLSSATECTDGISSISIGSNGRVIVSKAQRYACACILHNTRCAKTLVCMVRCCMYYLSFTCMQGA